MADLQLKRLEETIKEQGFNYKSLSLAAGLGETSVRDIITRRARNPRHDTLQKIAQKLGKPLSYFLAEDSDMSVPMVGEIAADTRLAGVLTRVSEAKLPSDIERVEAPPEMGYRNLVAVRIKGDALRPFLPNGTLIYYSASDEPREECLDHLCVIQVKNGSAVIKTLKRGLLYGTYHLEDYKGGVMENTEIEWAARIRFIRLP